ATESAAVLSSMGQVRSHIDGSNVRTTALLTVSSLGAMFDTFRIRLPEGDEYISYEELPVAGASEGEGLVSSVEETTDEAGGRVYVVKLAKETKGPVKLSLSTTRPLERRDEGESAVQGAELEGFEV